MKLPKEGNSIWSVVKDVGCSQLDMTEIWIKCQQNGKVHRSTKDNVKANRSTNEKQMEVNVCE